MQLSKREIDGRVHDVAFSNDNEQIAVAAEMGVIGPVSIKSSQSSETIRLPWKGKPASLAFCLQDTAIVISSRVSLDVNRLDLFSLGENGVRMDNPVSLYTPIERTWGVGVNAKGGLDVWTDSGFRSGRLPNRGRWMPRVKLSIGIGEMGHNHARARSNDGRLIAAPYAGLRGGMSVYSAKRRARFDSDVQRLCVFESGDNIRRAAFSPDDRWLVVQGSELHVWDMRLARARGAVAYLPRPASFVSFNGDGSMLAVQSSHVTRVFDTSDWSEIFESDALGWDPTPGFTVDDQLVVTSRSKVCFFSPALDNAKPISQVPVPEKATSWVKVSEDSRFALFYGNPRRVWDANEGYFEIVNIETGASVARREIVAGQTIDEAGDLEMLRGAWDWSFLAGLIARTSADSLWTTEQWGDRGRWPNGIGCTLRAADSKREIVELADVDTHDAEFSPDSNLVAFATDQGVFVWRLGPTSELVRLGCERLVASQADPAWPLDTPPSVEFHPDR